MPSHNWTISVPFSLVTHDITQGFWNYLDTRKQLVSPHYCRMYHLHCQCSPMATRTAAGRAEARSMILFSRWFMLLLLLFFFTSLCLFSRELSRPTSLLPTECSMGPGLGKDDDPLPPGLESLPLRLMQQECTAVKTLLLRLRRTLQEVGDVFSHSNKHMVTFDVDLCGFTLLPKSNYPLVTELSYEMEFWRDNLFYWWETKLYKPTWPSVNKVIVP